MTVDAAGIVLFRDLTVDAFFNEALRLGVSDPALHDADTYNRVFCSCLTRYRADRIAEVARQLQLPLTGEQIENIARHSLVPTVMTEPVLLSADEVQAAEKIYFHAFKAAMVRHGLEVADPQARKAARQLVSQGQQGANPWQRPLEWVGRLTLLVLGALALLAILRGLGWIPLL